MDTLPQIIDICRDAIDAGLIDESRDAFDDFIQNTSDLQTLEDYLQDVWDRIPSKPVTARIFN